MSTAFRSMGMSIVQIGLPSFVESIAGSLTSYGIIIGVFSVTQSIFQYPFAAVSDKLGRRRVILFGMLIYLLGTFLCFTAQDVIQLIIYRAIQGAGAYTSILQAIIGDIYKKDQHSKGMGYYSLYMNVGYFLGFVIGGYIASFLGFRSIFLISGFLICFSILFIFFVLKENNKTETIKDQDKNMEFNMINIKILLKERQYIFSLLFNCVRWFLFGFITAYLIWVLQDDVRGFALSEITSSYIMLAILALYVVFIFISNKLLDRYGPRKLMILGQIIVMVFGISFFFPDFVLNLPVFLIISSFLGIGIALFDPAGNTLLLEVIEDIQPDLKGSGIGFNNAIGFFCGAIAPMIMSPIGEIDIFFPFYVVFGLMIISLMISIFLVDKKY
ncbi:MAG TPA: MFS transporter [Candidatus Nanopelagicaceae bacterium]|nr:MFS transporter [Candidatus Nanopelagicaceae bacterium]